MNLFQEMLTDREMILDDNNVTVLNLNTRQGCRGLLEAGDCSADTSNGGLRNIIKANLWIPIEIGNFSQEHKLLITLPDGKQEEFTISACGARSGPFRKVELTQVKQTRMRSGVPVGM